MNFIDTQGRSGSKVVLIALFIELFVLTVFLILTWDSIVSLFHGAVGQGFSEMKNTLWFINIVLISTSIIYFFHKPFRNTTTILFGILNINWMAFSLFLMYPS